MHYIAISRVELGHTITKSHFGTNYLANREDRHNQGIEGDDVFGYAADLIGTNTFRYPGGAVTEMFFDLADTRHFSSADGALIPVSDRFTHRGDGYFTPVGQFLDFVNDRNGDATIVLPTITYFEDLASGDLARIRAVEAEIKNFVANALRHPSGDAITAFEIGNEYVSWTNERYDSLITSSRDYAMLARNISVWVNEAIEEANEIVAPDVIVQSSFFAQGPNGNNQLIRAFFDDYLEKEYRYVESVDDAVAAVTATSIHSYPYTPWERDAYKGTQSILDDLMMVDDWRDAFTLYADQNDQDIDELSAYVTEWNTRSAAIKNGITTGLEEATAFLSHFDTLIRAGVKEMHVWPLLQNNNSDLLNGNEVDELTLDFNGLMFSRMSRDLVGKSVLNLDSGLDIFGGPQDDLLVYGYEGDYGLSFYVASIANETVSISMDLSNLSDFTTGYGSIRAERITTEAHDHFDKFARPVIESLKILELEGSVQNDGIFYFNLDQGELIELHFYSGPSPNLVADHHLTTENSIVGTDVDEIIESLSGHDTIRALGGNDYIVAGDGNDVIDGGAGHDFIKGGANFDTISAGEGNDTVAGDLGRDLVFLNQGADLYTDNAQGGELGRDTVWGGFGDDVIQGGNGDDVFHGEWGNDLIYARLGDDLVFGGDQFDTISAGDGQDTVFGGNGRDLVFLNPGDDLFVDNGQGGQLGRDTVLGGFGNDTIEGGNGDDQFYGEWGDDLILAHLGNDTLWGGDGNDTINGGGGNDTLIGASGADRFVFDVIDAANGTDLITDFELGTDVLQLNVEADSAIRVTHNSYSNEAIVFVNELDVVVLRSLDNLSTLSVDNILVD